MNKKILTIIILAIAVVLAIMLLKSDKTAEPATESPEALRQELQGLDLGGLETEFQAIDKDLQSL